MQRNGYCQGRNSSGGDGDFRLPAGHAFPGIHHLGSTGADYTGGLWFFTVNGDVYPKVPAPSGSGELWRLLNAGASRTYDLLVRDDQTNSAIPFQVVSLDGGSLATPAGTTSHVGVGPAMDAVPCPGATMQASTPASAEGIRCGLRSVRSLRTPVCATHLVLFPGARAEIWVTPQSHSATLLDRNGLYRPDGRPVAPGEPRPYRCRATDSSPCSAPYFGPVNCRGNVA